MSSACVNNVKTPPENFLNHPPLYPPYTCFFPKLPHNLNSNKTPTDLPNPALSTLESQIDFEFPLETPSSNMLPADILFSDGKLLPLQNMPPQKPQTPESQNPPKSPKCATRWKQILSLKKLSTSKPPTKSNLYASFAENAKSFKHFLYKNPKSSPSDASLSIPLLRDSDSEPSISSRLSLSSSSSGEEFPRISFDCEKPNALQISNKPRPRFPKVKTSSFESNAVALVDSPRINASGKVIFQGLERSSSSPGSFNGRQRQRPNGMERSYSANVRVTPVLNVPVCNLRGSAISVSVFGIGQFFSAQRKEKRGVNGVSNAVRNGV